MMTFSKFCEKWEAMPCVENSFLRLGVGHPLDIQIGCGVNNYKSLVIMDTGAVKDVPSSYAVRVVNSQMDNGKMCLEFQLVHTSFEEEFQRLCWDLIVSTVESAQPLDDMIKRYMTWQRLFQYAKRGSLSFEEQKGLLGELLYLEEQINEIGAEEAVAAWCGPDGSDQDFVFAESWTEVKTAALAAESVRISSLQQLEQEVDGTLIVYLLEKSQEGRGKICLLNVVARIRRILGNIPLSSDSFEMKLFKYGYRNNEEFEYRKNWFRSMGKNVYAVTQDFPCLTRKNVPEGVVVAHYELSLAYIEQFRRR